MLQSEEITEVLLTHPLVPTGPIPTAYDPDGFYPYESFCETSRRPVLKKYRMVSIENDQIRVKICPDLGGRVCSIFLKKDAVETLFFPPIVRPVRILPRQCFTGGGVELSFPISHSPVETASVLYDVTRDQERIYVCCGERELRFGMHWTVEYSLGEKDAFLTQRTVFLNPDSVPHPWMSWSNAGVPARPDTEFHFPGGPVLRHAREMRTIDWEKEGPRRQSDVHRMTGFFWKKPDCYAFGVFTPSLNAGLYHVADPSQVPGIKLWSDGIGTDQAWVSQYTLDGEQCLEIQAGPLVDQSVKDVLQPGQRRHHVEYWIPSSTAREIRQISLPQTKMRTMDKVPIFGWARDEDVTDWLSLTRAKKSGDVSQIPQAPDVDNNRWAISGMADLGDALFWAARSTEGSQRNKWLFQFGAWLCGRGETDRALEVLAQSCDDRARALSGRLWLVHKHDPIAAANCFRAIKSEAIALHPQVVIERDRALAALSKETLDERGRWLKAVSALDDEWLAERRASWLVDSGDAQAALNLLRSTRFQLVHQRYERIRLWKQIATTLDLHTIEYPSWLGEDDLAEFGAYREHPEVQQR
ncbi:DUF5107 domain-containing protein [Edaphobacter bradus]|uniref:DUF5107 domain-containing protein n=1 Tax=Edaphobacter bradus TaxID=2259016 RepID=UPI0021E0E273|nr:DUF5107 domain-containing protein [Edaphobacter bradus]